MGITKDTKAQDIFSDSSSFNIRLHSKFLKNIHSTTLQSDITDAENSNSKNNSEYGIGNVLGKSKKTDKVYKKTGKSIKVQINLSKTKVLLYEIHLDKANFGITKALADE